MPRYIDADLMKQEENEAYQNTIVKTNGTEKALPNLIAHLTVQKLIDNAPTADVVEVVRCRDCKHQNSVLCPISFFKNKGQNDFCSYGEQREGERE